jgi:periplasmic divalent cation tolerance protein
LNFCWTLKPIMYILVLITCAKKQEALKVGKALLTKKLVACVNITDKVESFFWWRGKITRAREWLIIAKSTRSKLDKITKVAKSLHSYEVPEIIALAIAGGNKTYLDWIDDSIR